MKYKTFLAAVLALAGCLFTVVANALALPQAASAVEMITCPDDAERKTAENITLCYLPENEKDNKGKEKDLLWYIKSVINVILGLVGVVAVVALIFGGISFIVSQGDPGKVAKARSTIIYSIVGIVVALLAFAIVNFVLDNIFGKSKTTPATTVTTTQQ